jgi:hypothetical protein
MTSSAIYKDLELSVTIPGQQRAKASCAENENYSLTLAPLTRTPKINFGHTKTSCQVERDLLIINPQQFQVLVAFFYGIQWGMFMGEHIYRLGISFYWVLIFF